MLAFVAEDGAVDSLLALSCSHVDALIDELAPHEHCLATDVQHDLLAGAGESLVAVAPTVAIHIGAVVPHIEFVTVEVSIFCDPPERIQSSVLRIGSGVALLIGAAPAGQVLAVQLLDAGLCHFEVGLLYRWLWPIR